MSVPGFQVFNSNRLELLLDALAGILEIPLSSPLKREAIVVQSKGMERWLSLRLSEKLGVWANAAFPYPEALVLQLMKLNLPDLSESLAGTSREAMRWTIYDLLPGFLEQDEFKDLRNYLQGGGDLKRFQLAEKVAQAFDQYLVYRPALLAAWADGRSGLPEFCAHEPWQRTLWRTVMGRGDTPNRLDLRNRLLAIIADPGQALSGIPERLSIFGISSLPPFYLELFDALSRRIPVNVFLLNPCQEYWEDVKSHRQAAKLKARAGVSFDDLHYEVGNRLLSSMGLAGRHFLFNLPETCRTEDGFEAPGTDSLLHAIQSDILTLVDRGGAEHPDQPPLCLQEDDRSLHVHVCHSALREVQVLRDQLLDLFNTLPGLDPRDILVMAPDITPYVPLIETVFAAERSDPCHIPYAISDQAGGRSGVFTTLLLGLLDLPESRFEASRVMGLLENPAALRRLDLEPDAPERIRKWLAETYIRWGPNAEFKKRLDLPAERQNTWAFGLDRILLGYALPGDGRRMYGDIFPYDEIEGSDALTAGALAAFLEQLSLFAHEAQKNRTPSEWASFLNNAIDAFARADRESAPEREAIRQILQRLADESEAAGFEDAVPLQVMRGALSGALDSERSPAAFLSGGVTFCSLLPMRSIPARVLCLLGMNDGEFPRVDRPPGFDLISRYPRPGDRSGRNDDRYMFLEALISARDRLYLSYVGRSIQDNSIRPPSVLIAELLDAADQGFTLPQGLGAGKARDRIVTEHPLQPFSPRYFIGPEKKARRLFSYSGEWCEAARQIAGIEASPSPALFPSALPPPPPEKFESLSTDEFCRFWRNPVRYLVESRLDIRLRELEGELEDREPFSLDRLDEYLIRQQWLSAPGGEPPSEEDLARLRASGQIPPGADGERQLSRLALETKVIGQALDKLKEGKPTVLPIDLELDGLRIRGELRDLYPAHQLCWRAGKLKPEYLVQFWIRHLLLCAAGAPRKTLCAGVEKGELDCIRFNPVGSATELLRSLAGIFRTGCCEPIHFFPASSWAYMKKWQKGSAEEALFAARREWEGPGYNSGEKQTSPVYPYVFRDIDPLDDGFAKLTECILSPLLGALDNAK